MSDNMRDPDQPTRYARGLEKLRVSMNDELEMQPFTESRIIDCERSIKLT